MILQSAPCNEVMVQAHMVSITFKKKLPMQFWQSAPSVKCKQLPVGDGAFILYGQTSSAGSRLSAGNRPLRIRSPHEDPKLVPACNTKAADVQHIPWAPLLCCNKAVDGMIRSTSLARDPRHEMISENGSLQPHCCVGRVATNVQPSGSGTYY